MYYISKHVKLIGQPDKHYNYVRCRIVELQMFCLHSGLIYFEGFVQHLFFLFIFLSFQYPTSILLHFVTVKITKKMELLCVS